MITEEVPVAAPPESRFARLRRRILSMRRRTLWLNTILALLLIVAIIVAFSVFGTPSTEAVVRTATVTRGTVTAKVSGSGNTESLLSTPVSFETSGTVTAITVKPGDTVTLGQVLATVDKASSDESLRIAQADLDSANAALAQAEAGPTEVKKQQDQLAITTAQQDLDSARVAVTAAQDQLALDKASTATAVRTAQTTYNNDKASTDTTIKSAKATLKGDTATQNAAVASAQATVNSVVEHVDGLFDVVEHVELVGERPVPHHRQPQPAWGDARGGAHALCSRTTRRSRRTSRR